MDQEAIQNDPIDPPASSSSTITSGHIPFTKLGLTPLTPSKQHTKTCLDTIFYDKTRKTIRRRSEKRLKTTTHDDVVTVTENVVMEGTNKDLKFMASIRVAAV